MGPGCAFLDYDGDGWLDILLVNGMDWPGHKRQRSTLHLYRNNRNGTFTDVTRSAGLAVEMYGMGVAVGDYNNDGFPDILITAVGQNRLFQNTGKGHFIDVTEKAGLGGRSAFSTSALWFDFDRDGLLDLLVCNYVQVVAGARCVLQRGRQAQILLHAGGVPRRHLLAVPQSRQRHVRRCHREERHLRHHLEIAGRGAARLRSRRLAGPDRRQRHAAQQAATATSATAPSRMSPCAPAWRSAKTARRAPEWASTSADFDNSGAEGIAITNFDNEMMALYRPRRGGVYTRCRDASRDRAALRATAWDSAALSSISIWTAASICSR